ncbi:hypothetical protein [Spirilliplanes yamanashiensis]|uniref:Uncharacterized protein n=1 Tax=Spirilliplanes yamanashiensis TaxID=42233 RepID=A0A8J3YCX4_9ACTN|nr:hypothetical protein [Spirilliplanes yamanashiensis]MDP9818478.1 hypothetical protein [Spirilliplanes yamanashiensis]GIJ06396.1 hypothetical protein Sya03_57480 [Spirilliplanes yamanashiensis]
MTSETHVPLRDADALDAICAALNTVTSCADVVQEVTLIVRAAGRPYVDDLCVIEAGTHQSPHGLPRAAIHVDGEEAVRVWADEQGAVHVRVSNRHPRRPYTVEIDGAPPPRPYSTQPQ